MIFALGIGVVLSLMGLRSVAVWKGYTDSHRVIASIDRHFREARFLAFYHRKPVVLCAAHPSQHCGEDWSYGLIIWIEDVPYHTHLFKKNHLKVTYHGFPDQTIPIDSEGFLIGNGHFDVMSPSLPSKTYILNQHGALYLQGSFLR